jgi:hypothetical protein
MAHQLLMRLFLLRRTFVPRVIFPMLILLLVSCGPKPAPVESAAPTTQTESPTSPALIETKHSPSKSIWQPAPGTSWQWQLSDTLDLSVEAQVYDIDLFDNDASLVADLHSRGIQVICYISAGSWENWRPDASQFPKEIIGKDYVGWEGEKWLDIRRLDLLAPIMRARMDLCAQKGFDGLEPDNLDAYANDSGFPLTYEDQLKYNRWLSEQAHARGLSIGLKNDGAQAAELVSYFDWALTEDCFYNQECGQMSPFVQAGKQIIDTEYTDTGITLDEFCPQAEKLGLTLIFKNRELDAFRRTCP